MSSKSRAQILRLLWFNFASLANVAVTPRPFLLSKKGRGVTATFAKDAKLNQSNRNICARDLLDMMQVKWIFPSVRVVLRDSPAAVVLRTFAPHFHFCCLKKAGVLPQRSLRTQS